MAELIKVTFPDGDEVCYRHPVNTVLEVLKRLGEEKFSEISLMRGGRRVVSQDYDPKLKAYIREIVPGWYYFNQSDTREKTNQLININRQFNLGLTIDAGNFTGTQNPRLEGLTRRKNRLVVTMPDGTIINHDSYKEVFAECIRKFGPRRVSSSANIEVSRNRDLLSPTNPNGNRVKVAENLYLEIPVSAKEALKTLKIIASRLRENINVEYLPM